MGRKLTPNSTNKCTLSTTVNFKVPFVIHVSINAVHYGLDKLSGEINKQIFEWIFWTNGYVDKDAYLIFSF